MLYLSEILAAMLAIIAVIVGMAGGYVLIRSYHRKWRWQDEVNQNNMRKAIMDDLSINYEVDESGFVRPVINRRERSSAAP